MTPMNGKTPVASGVCQCVEPCLICCGDSTIDTPKIQPPLMGSALRAYLKRYCNHLQPYAEATGDRVAAGMIDCCCVLLIEADRLERVRR